MSDVIEAMARAIYPHPNVDWDDARLIAREALRAAEEAGWRLVQGWQPIETAPTDDTLFLARTDDGRVMVWTGTLLAHALSGRTPNHLQFPATMWMPIPPLAAAIRGGATE